MSFLDSEKNPNIPMENEANVLKNDPEIAKHYNQLNKKLDGLFVQIIEEGIY